MLLVFLKLAISEDYSSGKKKWINVGKKQIYIRIICSNNLIPFIKTNLFHQKILEWYHFRKKSARKEKIKSDKVIRKLSKRTHHDESCMIKSFCNKLFIVCYMQIFHQIHNSTWSSLNHRYIQLQSNNIIVIFLLFNIQNFNSDSFKCSKRIFDYAGMQSHQFIRLSGMVN